ncbi:MAG TPA: beta-ketoacyl synthase N-terminal-like domain-containing protein [Myxococcota bacterium]|nr:beta-ketoacyl synthase N-terminal-like domain-containing protein [Myxococcota bacterium]
MSAIASLQFVCGLGEEPRLREVLLRRKDRKLLSRPAKLALPAAARAVSGYPDDLLELGLFVGVRREPPDDGEADAAIAASHRDGELDVGLLAAAGRDLYPPLLPLKTLPNMVLAHISINLGIMGPADTCAGGPAAGVSALRLAMQAVDEGRAPAALVVVADSHVDGSSRRDLLRRGITARPGEAAVAVLVVPGSGLVDEGGGRGGVVRPFLHHGEVGWCGTADPLVALARGQIGIEGVDEGGAWTRVRVVP